MTQQEFVSNKEMRIIGLLFSIRLIDQAASLFLKRIFDENRVAVTGNTLRSTSYADHNDD